MKNQIKKLIFYALFLLAVPSSVMAIEVVIDGLRYLVDENQEEIMLQGRTSNFWKTYGGKYQPITDKAVNITGDLEFQDEIKPDGATCAVGEILKRTGADNWDCAADATGGGATDQLGQIGDVATTTLATNYTLHYDGTNWVSSSTLSVDANTGNVSLKDNKYLYFDTAGTRGIKYGSDHGELVFPDDYSISTEGELGFFANSLADASGNWEPSFQLCSDGVAQLKNTTQGSAGYKYFLIEMSDGVRLNTTGSEAIIKADNLATSDKTFQFPNWSGDFLIGSTTSLYVADNGDVGIGTTSPYKLLSVAGDGHFDGDLSVDGDVILQDDKHIYLSTLQDYGIKYDSNNNIVFVGSLANGNDSDLVSTDKIAYYANVLIDGSGTWEPSWEMMENGQLLFTNTTQGNVGDKYALFTITDGFRINTGGAKNAIIKADNIATSDKTFQFPNLNGTFLMATGTQDFITTGSVGIATATPNASYVLDVYGNSRIDGTLKIGAYTLPATDGTANYVLKTDGSGALTWQADNDTGGASSIATLNAQFTGETVASTTWAGASSILTVGILDSGSITSNFGNIDIGSSNFDADGTITSTGVIDFGGATSLEIPNTAGDVTVNASGEIAIDTTQNQLAVYSGAEKVLPLNHILQGSFDPGGWYDADAEVWMVDFHADTYPDGIVITSWYVDCNVADPDVEMDMNLKYADAVGGAAFPGASSTLIDVMNTTTGNSSEATMSNSNLGSGVIPTGKSLYINFDADPEGTCNQLHIKIHFYIPES